MGGGLSLAQGAATGAGLRRGARAAPRFSLANVPPFHRDVMQAVLAGAQHESPGLTVADVKRMQELGWDQRGRAADPNADWDAPVFRLPDAPVGLGRTCCTPSKSVGDSCGEDGKIAWIGTPIPMDEMMCGYEVRCEKQGRCACRDEGGMYDISNGSSEARGICRDGGGTGSPKGECLNSKCSYNDGADPGKECECTAECCEIHKEGCQDCTTVSYARSANCPDDDGSGTEEGNTSKIWYFTGYCDRPGDPFEDGPMAPDAPDGDGPSRLPKDGGFKFAPIPEAAKPPPLLGEAALASDQVSCAWAIQDTRIPSLSDHERTNVREETRGDRIVWLLEFENSAGATICSYSMSFDSTRFCRYIFEDVTDCAFGDRVLVIPGCRECPWE